jgi:CHAT domain-containing protein/tetratricopeptide (TPR) repeat protein
MALWLAAGQTPPSSGAAEILRLGQPVAREIRPGETQRFTVDVGAEQFANVALVHAATAVLTLSLTGPSGNLPEAVAGDSASWIGRSAGTYQVTVAASSGSSSETIRYEIQLTDLRPPSETDTSRIQAQAKFYSATVSEKGGDQSSALQQYREAAAIWRKLGDEHNALAAYQRALTMHRANRNLSGEASILGDIASVYYVLGEQQMVLDTSQRILSLRRETGNRAGETVALTNLGSLYRDLGAEDTALDYFRQAINAGRSSGVPASTADALMGIGDVQFFLGEKQKSIDAYEQSLALKRSVQDRSGEALALIGLGNVYSDLAGRQKPEDSGGAAGRQKGLEYYEESLKMGRASGDYTVQVFALMGAGAAYSAQGDKQKAMEYFNQALFIFGIARLRQGTGWARYEMARVERDRGNLTQALTYAVEARDIAESLRATVVSQDLRASFFAAIRDCYSLEIDVLMRLYAANPSGTYLADALTASERARARVLLESLGESRAEIREGVDPALLERERQLQAELNAKEMARLRLVASGSASKLSGEIEKAVRDLAAQYEELNTQIRERSPHYAALKFPKPLSLAEIQKQVLDKDTLLLEFALGDERSFAWLVSTDRITAAVLPRRTVVEAAARRFHDALLDPAAGAAEFGEALGKMLLGEIGAHLEDKRLLIVADGALQYLPFAALPEPGSGQPLIARHEMVNLPSASTLAVLRGEYGERKPAPKAVAILADPVFSAEDSRINRGNTRSTQRGVDPYALHLPRLPGTRREAAAIASLAPENSRKQALDFDASRAALTAPDLKQYRILHLATHGILNTEHPELSGVALSLVDRKGNPQDGFLRLHEIYNLKFGADLVVLSACQTALGKEIQGEGLVGLTRGFMYAGAPRVVASLWKVDDRATAELMRRFYSGMLGPTALRPAAALRSAQVDLWKTRGWENPYYWAAFTLQGEWR